VTPYFVASERVERMPRPIGGPQQVPAGRLHAFRPGAQSTECGQPLQEAFCWPDVAWVPVIGRGWCRACTVHTFRGE
jgi:hypothetical protein